MHARTGGRASTAATKPTQARIDRIDAGSVLLVSGSAVALPQQSVPYGRMTVVVPYTLTLSIAFRALSNC